jgi:microcystin-dependent protein
MSISDRRQSVIGGTGIKTPCRVATTANITLYGLQTVDGVALAEDDRVLVKNQTTASLNGLYNVSTGDWTRTRDCDGTNDMVTGTLVKVTAGTLNKGVWELTTAGAITIDSTSLTFTMITNALSGVSSFVNTMLSSVSAAAFMTGLGFSAFVQTLISAVDATAFLALLGIRPVEPGTIVDFAGSTAPTGYELCYGQAVSRTTYAALFAAISTTYGSGNGVSTFNLPDARGRVTAGKDNMGGVAANRLNAATTGGVDGATLGAVGGEKDHVNTIAETAAHSHANALVDPSHLHFHTAYSLASNSPGSNSRNSDGGSGSGGSSTNTNSAFTGMSITNASTGGGAAHNNVQATIVFNKIIKI